jgi:hypothetical protein
MVDCREALDGLDFGRVAGGRGEAGPVNENNVHVRRQRYEQQEWIKKVSTGVLIVVGVVVLGYYLVLPMLVRFWNWGMESGFFGKCYLVNIWRKYRSARRYSWDYFRNPSGSQLMIKS